MIRYREESIAIKERNVTRATDYLRFNWRASPALVAHGRTRFLDGDSGGLSSTFITGSPVSENPFRVESPTPQVLGHPLLQVYMPVGCPSV